MIVVGTRVDLRNPTVMLLALAESKDNYDVSSAYAVKPAGIVIQLGDSVTPVPSGLKHRPRNPLYEESLLSLSPVTPNYYGDD